jgi:dienelactone hydrolase
MKPPNHHFIFLLILICITANPQEDAMSEQQSHHELAHVFTDPSQTVDDARIHAIRGVSTPYTFPGYTKAEWSATAAELRTHILVSTGMMPMPEKTPLNAQIFDKIERDDYTVEKVYFEAFPGFFTTGNLYRPKGKTGPFPGIVSPHGHWGRGRLENVELGSIPGRCINFAKQGYVIFAYDMIGYNDSGQQITHRYGGAREWLWGLSAMGLQLLNAIRAVDFLQSLPDVDPEQLGCTGASGGGTQTFMLMAIDERVKVAAPVNMISAHMQGGCLCENAPNLRLDLSNLEIGGMMAPRPLLLVSATGDWTVNTPTVEYPAIRSIYAHFDAEDRVHQVQVDAAHNYNKLSREAVYAWFGKWFLGEEDASKLKEVPFEVEPDEDLLAFSKRAIPYYALNGEELRTAWAHHAKRQLEERKPTNASELESFRKEIGAVLRHALAVETPTAAELQVESVGEVGGDNFTAHRLLIGRNGVGDKIPAVLFTPKTDAANRTANVVVHEAGKAGLIQPETGEPVPLVSGLLAAGHAVLTIDTFLTGEYGDIERKENEGHFTTYNRTVPALRIQDILTAVAYLNSRDDMSAVNLIGIGAAGAWSLLAAGYADVTRVVADANGFDNSDDAAYLQSLSIPILRRAGDFRTAGSLIAPRPLLIHNTGDVFRTDWIRDVYGAVGASARLKVEKEAVADDTILEWLTSD